MAKLDSRTASALALALLLAALPLAGRASDTPGDDAGPGVARAVFARAIADREPTEVVSALDSRAQTVFFFSELRGLEGQTVLHRWEFNGKTMAEVPFQVRADHWRIYSSKQLHPEWVGTWTVTVVDASGRTLHRSTLEYGLEQAHPAAPSPVD